VASVKVSDEVYFAKFNEFMSTHNVQYSTIEEMQERFKIFRSNYLKVVTHNTVLTSEKHSANATFGFGLTKFMDLTPEEFAKTHLNLNLSVMERIEARTSPRVLSITNKSGPAPENFDWRDQGVVSPVKNQGSCGSCWAFSAIGNIESQLALQTKTITQLSEQELVDCDKAEDEGCNGGLMESAFKYLETVGVVSEADYKYTGRDGTCSVSGKQVVAKITGYHYAGTEDETQIKQLLFENGPFAIAINATPLQFYFWGIFNPWLEFLCSPTSLNHGVLLVGYGVEGSTPYWIVKNSWGGSWGEKGYFRIIAGKGACGLNTYVITAEVAKN
jgi:C1A family cysteine protease